MTALITQIDHYKDLIKIGEGGMGDVYKGIDNINRKVAIKLLKPELSRDTVLVQRFIGEAEAMGQLDHPNIARLYTFGQMGDMHYMVLEFVNGETLDEVLKRKLSMQKSVQYAIAILEGLDHAHGQNIIHRDIKPSNIMINENGILKILDFGIAKILGKAGNLTKVGYRVGTPAYISPEQSLGRMTDVRSDIYSVGIVLYEMLTGQLPFEKETEDELFNSQIEEKPKSPRTFSSEIPPLLDKAVMKALEKKPEKRFASAIEFSHVLREIKFPAGSIQQTAKVKHFCGNNPGLTFLFCSIVISTGYISWQMMQAHTMQPVITATQAETVIVQEAPVLAKINREIDDQSNNIPEFSLNTKGNLIKRNNQLFSPNNKEKDSSDAQFKMGNDYYNGNNNHKKNYQQALNWFKKAAENGHSAAQDMVGYMYLKGEGTNKNFAEAKNWYEKAAIQGDGSAQKHLGDLFYTGKGTSKNLGKALSWYIKAAEQGNSVAQNNAGYMFETGQGVGVDRVQARLWYERAAKQGDKEAVKSLKKLTGIMK